MTNTILVVDDDRFLAELVKFNLESEGYRVVVARDGLEGVKSFYEVRPDLAIIDISMPKMNGFELCKRIREFAQTPVIILTARGSDEDIVHGLDAGADDYVTKPFQVKVLLARIRSNLRRAQADLNHQPGVAYQDDRLVIDLDARRIVVDGELVKMTPIEYKLLAYLVFNKGRVLEFRQLLENVWGFEYIDDVDYLRVYIWHLRRKLEKDPKQPQYFLNELNVGYRFEPQN